MLREPTLNNLGGALQDARTQCRLPDSERGNQRKVKSGQLCQKDLCEWGPTARISPIEGRPRPAQLWLGEVAVLLAGIRPWRPFRLTIANNCYDTCRKPNRTRNCSLARKPSSAESISFRAVRRSPWIRDSMSVMP